MDCSKCHHKCQSECCAIFPMPANTFYENQDKIVTQPEEIKQFMGPEVTEDLSIEKKEILHILPLTKDNRCCFLNKDLSCNIYENRPTVCRKFGDETNVYLKCTWQSKDGRMRSRQERRSIEREIDKHHSSMSKLIQLRSKPLSDKESQTL